MWNVRSTRRKGAWDQVLVSNLHLTSTSDIPNHIRSKVFWTILRAGKKYPQRSWNPVLQVWCICLPSFFSWSQYHECPNNLLRKSPKWYPFLKYRSIFCFARDSLRVRKRPQVWIHQQKTPKTCVKRCFQQHPPSCFRCSASCSSKSCW